MKLLAIEMRVHVCLQAVHTCVLCMFVYKRQGCFGKTECGDVWVSPLVIPGSMRVCRCGCLQACACLSACISAHVHVSAYVQARLSVCVYVECVCLCVRFVCVYVCARPPCVPACVDVCTCLEHDASRIRLSTCVSITKVA
jgi:hypothetical protein